MQLPFLLIFKLDLLFCRPKLNQPLVVPIAAGGWNRDAVENRLNALEGTKVGHFAASYSLVAAAAAAAAMVATWPTTMMVSNVDR